MIGQAVARNLLFLTSSTLVWGCFNVHQLRHSIVMQGPESSNSPMREVYLLASAVAARLAVVDRGTSFLINANERRRSRMGPRG